MGLKFGEFIRKLRIDKDITLREFAKSVGLDVGNLSKIENGIANPPQKKSILKQISKSLQLTTAQEKKLDELSTHEVGKYPEDVCDELRNYEYIPLLLRTIANKKLTDEQIKELTKQINSKK